MSPKDRIKEAARGRWKELLTELGGLAPQLLDGNHHPCPKCGGSDRFRLIDEHEGAVLCNQCLSKRNGDGLSALQWLRGWDFKETLRQLGDKLNVPLRARKKPDDDLVFVDWSQPLVELWGQKKGITADTAAANGARLARWRKSQMVITFPIVRVAGGKPHGFAMYDLGGQPLLHGDGKTAKILCTKGSESGWIGTHGVDNLEQAEVVWKVEGVSDMLALWQRIPAELRSKHVVITNPFGSRETPKGYHVKPVTGKKVVVVHDTDQAGREGATKWAKALAVTAERVRILDLPAPTDSPKPLDLRDWLELGNTFENLYALATEATVIEHASGVDDVEEAPADPSRLGRLFVQQHAGRFAAYQNTSYYWLSGRWVAVSDSEFRGDVHRFIRQEFHRVHREELEAHERKEGETPTVHPIHAGLITSVIGAARDFAYVSDRIPWQSELLDRGRPGVDLEKANEFERRDWIAVDNGLLHVNDYLEGSNECLQPHNPEWWSLIRLPFAFDPRAGTEQRPRWENFLERNLEGDYERIAVVQEWAGYLLLPDTKEHTFMMLEGEGSNGKSVYCAMIEALLGQDNVSYVPLECFHERFALTPTIGKLANIATEIGEVDKIAEGKLKQFTAGESLMFDRKGKEPVAARPTARLMFATNNRPRVADKSKGVWRRMILMPWRVEIPKEDRVLGMDRPEWWVRSGEMPAILNWALDGLARLRLQGRFTESAVCEEAKRDYQIESNPAREFLLENFETWDQGQMNCQELYNEYSEWCGKNGYHALGERTFGREVRRTYPTVERVRPRLDGERKYVYLKLSRKNPSVT